MPPRTESWSHLPPELLVTIADHHSTSLDVLRLRSICQSWRNSVSRDRPGDSSIWSLRIPFPVVDPLDLIIEGRYSLTKSSVCYLVEPERGQGWLVKIEESGPGRLRALDPVSTVKLGGFPKVLNLVDWRVLEIARSFSLGFSDVKKENLSIDETRYLAPKKVAVSSADGNVESGGMVMGIFEGGSLLHIRAGDEKWGNSREWQLERIYSDVAFWKDRFYAMDAEGNLVILDRSLNVEDCPWSGIPQDSREQKYLVEASGFLYLVVNKNLSLRLFYSDDSVVGCVSDEDEVSRIWFEVFCFREAEKDWVQVYSLGELAFFVADDCSFSVVADDCPPYKRSCIYYSDYDVGDSSLQASCRVFDLEKSYSQTQPDCGQGK
uniref:KIB1-4 beta-propeller domain-containing protein n=1 Tax=Kalanchoe fedtschenkoi TaxID=63787 RepID=A0A7N0UIK9_KALFE